MVRLIAIFLPLLLLGCTRKTEMEPLRDAAGISVTPRGQDTKLPGIDRTSGPRPAVKPVLAFQSQKYSTERYLRLVDDLRSLGRVDSDDAIGGLAASMYKGFHENPALFTHTTFLGSPIASAIAGEGEAPIRDAVTSIGNDLRVAVNALNGLLVQSSKTYPWPRTLPHFSQAIESTDQYSVWLNAEIQKLQIDGKLKAAAQQQLQTQYAKYRPTFAALTAKLDGARHLGEAVDAVQGGIKALGLSLAAADAEKLRQAGALAQQLSSMENSRDALAILITVWRMTPPEQRGPTFQKVSPELYSFLSSKSDADLSCLATFPCVNPLLAIAKQMIFPKLEAYGLEKLRDQIDASARDSVVVSARAQVIKALPGLPLFVRDTVNQQTAPLFALVAKVKADVPGFARDHVKTWASAHFAQPLRGLETSGLVVSLAARDQIRVEPAADPADVVSTGAGTLGASLALSQTWLPEGDEAGLRAAVVEPLLKVLAIGGFRQASGKPFPGFMMPIDGKVSDVFFHDDLMKTTKTFAVPDAFKANALFQMDRVHARKNVSAGEQAELLKGISRQIGFYRDWEQGAYDVSLGRVLIEDLVPELPKGLVRTSFLPKDVLFAMTLANAGAILENLVLDLSPAFILLEDGSLLWGNHYKEIKGNKVSTVAGMVSLVDGKRDGIVRTADVARYVLALDEFMAATEGMENSTSSVLQGKTQNGQSTLLADMVDIRKKLQLVEMGLANYLVYVAEQPDGSLASQFKATTRLELSDTPRRLEDQALAVRALLAAAKRLDLPMFRWSALDIYFGMNKNFFDPSKEFYAGEIDGKNGPARPASLDEIVLTLLAGEELREVMPNDTRSQWDQLAKPYLKALQDL